MARAEAPTTILRETHQPQIPQNTENSCKVEFRLGSPMAYDDLVQYFDNLRVDNLPVEVKFDQDPETSGSVVVSFPLPIEAIVNSIDLVTLNGIILKSQI